MIAKEINLRITFWQREFDEDFKVESAVPLEVEVNKDLYFECGVISDNNDAKPIMCMLDQNKKVWQLKTPRNLPCGKYQTLAFYYEYEGEGIAKITSYLDSVVTGHPVKLSIADLTEMHILIEAETDSGHSTLVFIDYVRGMQPRGEKSKLILQDFIIGKVDNSKITFHDALAVHKRHREMTPQDFMLSEDE